MEDQTKQVLRSRLITGIVFASIALSVSGLLQWADSFFIGLWVLMNIPAALLGIMFTGNIHDYVGFAFYVGVAIQWFLIGVIAHRIYTVKRFGKKAA